MGKPFAFLNVCEKDNKVEILPGIIRTVRVRMTVYIYCIIFKQSNMCFIFYNNIKNHKHNIAKNYFCL